MLEKRGTCIHAITKHGFAIAQRLQAKMPDAEIYVSRKICAEPKTGITPVALPLGPVLAECFHRFETHVFIISVGAVVRMIAPFLKDKKVDPAVVCIDDAGQFAICLLSGHVGGGNRETLKIAQALGCQPVITTASDVQGTLMVDILGRELAWVLADHDHNITSAAAAVVNEKAVLVVQEAGQTDFWPHNKPWPPGIHYQTKLDGICLDDWEHLLVISDRLIPELYPELYQKAVVYHPPSLWVGIGCDRGAPAEFLERGLLHVLKEFKLSPHSLAGFASIDLKNDELGLLALSEKYRKPIRWYSASELDQTRGIANPSLTVQQHVGTRSVSEAACLRAAQTDEILVPKQKYSEVGVAQKMTVSVARQVFPARLSEGSV